MSDSKHFLDWITGSQAAATKEADQVTEKHLGGGHRQADHGHRGAQADDLPDNDGAPNKYSSREKKHLTDHGFEPNPKNYSEYRRAIQNPDKPGYYGGSRKWETIFKTGDHYNVTLSSGLVRQAKTLDAAIDLVDRLERKEADQVTEKHEGGGHDQKSHGLRGAAAGSMSKKPGGAAAEGGAGGAGGSGQAGGPTSPPRALDLGPDYPADIKDWEAMPIGDRLKKWGDLGKEENGPAKQDMIANARHAIRANQQKRLADLGIGRRPNYTGDTAKAIEKRLDQAKNAMMDDSRAACKETLHSLDKDLEAAGVEPKLRHKILMESADALIVQENESISRQLGDHGINHLKGNIDVAKDILAAHPSPDSPEDRATVALAGIFHDTGYMTDPSTLFMDRGHERWAAQHYNTHIKPLIDRALGRDRSSELENIIRTHAGSDIDWENDRVTSAFRVADNLAMFAAEKLPGLYRYVPENIGLLGKLKKGEIDVAGVQDQMRRNIDKSDLPAWMKNNLMRAVGEVSGIAPKMALGMLGGSIRGLGWKNGALVVRLAKDERKTTLQKVMDLGQKQFKKWIESWGVDPADIPDNLNWQLKKKNGDLIMVTETVVEKALAAANQALSALQRRLNAMIDLLDL